MTTPHVKEYLRSHHMQAIVAVDRNGVVGNGSTMGWHDPEDLAYFRDKTKHTIMVVGSTTFHGLPEQVRTDPTRPCIVLTSKCQGWQEEGYFAADSLKYLALVLNTINPHRLRKVSVIGGGRVYDQLVPLCTDLLITRLDIKSEGSIGLWIEPDYWVKTKTTIGRHKKDTENNRKPNQYEHYKRID